MTSTPFHNIDPSKAKALADKIAKRLSGKAQRFDAGLTSLNALYRVCAKLHQMNLHIHVGDRVQTIWVQNFRLSSPYLMLAFAANEPERASALVEAAEVGLGMPVFINSYLYCGAELVQRFCQENRREIHNLRLEPEERLSVQRGQIRLRLMTDDVERIEAALDEIGRIFQRYTPRPPSG